MERKDYDVCPLSRINCVGNCGREAYPNCDRYTAMRLALGFVQEEVAGRTGLREDELSRLERKDFVSHQII
jgi:hypothetical protein